MLDYEEHYRYLTTEFVPEGSRVTAAFAELIAETTVYSAGDRRFTFIGERHGVFDADIGRILEEIFDWTAPASVLIEMPIGTDMARLAKATPVTPMFYVAKLAMDRKIPVRGYELTYPEIFSFFTDRLGSMDGFKLALYWWVANAYRNCLAMRPDKRVAEAYICARKNAIAALTQGKLAQRYSGKFEDLCGNSGQEEAVDAAMAEITKKYVGDMPYLEALGTEVYAPYPFGKMEINKINARLEAYRNCLLAVEIMKDLGRFSSVLAVGGSGHVREMREPFKAELEAEFGECRMARACDLLTFSGTGSL